MTRRPPPAADAARRPALPSDHAFVVQFREQSGAAGVASAGRVQHVSSGEATHFESPEELLAFARRVLGRGRPTRGAPGS